MKPLLILALWAVSAFAQANPSTNVPQYCSTSGDVSLTGAGTTFTVQIGASGGLPAITKSVVLQYALVTTSVAGAFTQTVNGTNATATAGTITQTPTGAPTIASQATAWTASNVGAGTPIAGKITTFAGGPGITVDLTNNGYNVILKPVTNSNYSIVIASMTGTANVTVCWHEQ
jgi:hypothetical protein